MQKLLIFGASSLVGKAVATHCMQDFDVYGTYNTGTTPLPAAKQFQLAMEAHDDLTHILQHVQPDYVISSLQGDYLQQLAFHEKLASQLPAHSTLYFISTTNVFDGDLSRHHDERDTPISMSDYGQYKIQCEQMLRDRLGERAVIVRIPAIWGKDSPRFQTLLQNIANGAPVTAYSNLQWSVLTDVHLATQLHYLLLHDVRGTIHLGASDYIVDAAFHKQLLHQLDYEDVSTAFVPYEQRQQVYYFGLKASRHILPEALHVTNYMIIDYLSAKEA